MSSEKSNTKVLVPKIQHISLERVLASFFSAPTRTFENGKAYKGFFLKECKAIGIEKSYLRKLLKSKKIIKAQIEMSNCVIETFYRIDPKVDAAMRLEYDKQTKKSSSS